MAFGILYWIYNTKVVPKMEASSHDAAAIEGGMKQAEEAQAQAQAALEQYKPSSRTLAPRRTRSVRTLARAGCVDRPEMRGQAQAEASRITESAKRQIDAERQQAVVQLRQEVGTLSTSLASKIVGESLDDEVRQKGIVDFLAELEAGDVKREKVDSAAESGQDA